MTSEVQSAAEPIPDADGIWRWISIPIDVVNGDAQDKLMQRIRLACLKKKLAPLNRNFFSEPSNPRFRPTVSYTLLFRNDAELKRYVVAIAAVAKKLGASPLIMHALDPVARYKSYRSTMTVSPGSAPWKFLVKYGFQVDHAVAAEAPERIAGTWRGYCVTFDDGLTFPTETGCKGTCAVQYEPSTGKVYQHGPDGFQHHGKTIGAWAGTTRIPVAAAPVPPGMSFGIRNGYDCRFCDGTKLTLPTGIRGTSAVYRDPATGDVYESGRDGWYKLDASTPVTAATEPDSSDVCAVLERYRGHKWEDKNLGVRLDLDDLVVHGNATMFLLEFSVKPTTDAGQASITKVLSNMHRVHHNAFLHPKANLKFNRARSHADLSISATNVMHNSIDVSTDPVAAAADIVKTSVAELYKWLRGVLLGQVTAAAEPQDDTAQPVTHLFERLCTAVMKKGDKQPVNTGRKIGRLPLMVRVDVILTRPYLTFYVNAGSERVTFHVNQSVTDARLCLRMDSWRRSPYLEQGRPAPRITPSTIFKTLLDAAEQSLRDMRKNTATAAAEPATEHQPGTEFAKIWLKFYPEDREVVVDGVTVSIESTDTAPAALVLNFPDHMQYAVTEHHQDRKIHLCVIGRGDYDTIPTIDPHTPAPVMLRKILSLCVAHWKKIQAKRATAAVEPRSPQSLVSLLTTITDNLRKKPRSVLVGRHQVYLSAGNAAGYPWLILRCAGRQPERLYVEPKHKEQPDSSLCLHFRDSHDVRDETITHADSAEGLLRSVLARYASYLSTLDNATAATEPHAHRTIGDDFIVLAQKFQKQAPTKVVYGGIEFKLTSWNKDSRLGVQPEWRTIVVAGTGIDYYVNLQGYNDEAIVEKVQLHTNSADSSLRLSFLQTSTGPENLLKQILDRIVKADGDLLRPKAEAAAEPTDDAYTHLVQRLAHDPIYPFCHTRANTHACVCRQPKQRGGGLVVTVSTQPNGNRIRATFKINVVNDQLLLESAEGKSVRVAPLARFRSADELANAVQQVALKLFHAQQATAAAEPEPSVLDEAYRVIERARGRVYATAPHKEYPETRKYEAVIKFTLLESKPPVWTRPTLIVVTEIRVHDSLSGLTSVRGTTPNHAYIDKKTGELVVLGDIGNVHPRELARRHVRSGAEAVKFVLGTVSKTIFEGFIG